MKITISPRSGLFNRMRTLSCAYNLSKLTGRKVEVRWDVDPGNCPFTIEEVFDYLPFDQSPAGDDYAPWGGYIKSCHVPFLAEGVVFEEASNYAGEIDRMMLVEKDWYLVSGGNFKPLKQAKSEVNANKSEFYNVVKFKNHVTEKARQTSITTPYTGVHLRYTDRVHLASSDVYVDEIIKSIDGPVFLCSDDDAKLKLFSERHSKVFTQQDKTPGRHSLAGLESGIVDWLVLSKSCKIYASIASSFSIEARYPNRLPLVQITEAGIQDLDFMGDEFA